MLPNNTFGDISTLLQVMDWCRQERAITQAIDDRSLCRPMLSLGHNELNQTKTYHLIYYRFSSKGLDICDSDLPCLIACTENIYIYIYVWWLSDIARILRVKSKHHWIHEAWARFLSLSWSKLRMCSAKHRVGYFSNLVFDWLSIVWAYSQQGTTANGPKWQLSVNSLRPSDAYMRR